MSSNKAMRLVKQLPLAAVVMLVVVACGRGDTEIAPSGGAPGATTSQRHTYFSSEISISHLPKLYEPFTVTAKFTSIKEDIPDAELWLIAGDAYFDGEGYWHGPLKAGESRTLSARFVFLREENSGVAVYASWSPGFYEFDSDHSMYVSENYSQWGHKTSPHGIGDGCGSRDSYVTYPIGMGHPIIHETSLLLNTSPLPRLEFVQSQEDVKRLQSEGLLPDPLRYQWNALLPSRFNFSEMFLIIYWDGMKPTTGNLVTRPTCFWMDDGIIKGKLAAYSLPPQVLAPQAPSSPVVVMQARYESPRGKSVPSGPPGTLDVRGNQAFEFTLDGEPFENVTVVLSPEPTIAAPTETPPITPPEEPAPWELERGPQTGTAYVTLGLTALSPGEETLIPIVVTGINDPDGLGAYELEVNYDPLVVRVVEALPGEGLFEDSPTYKIDSAQGFIKVIGLQASAIPGSIGDVVVGYLRVEAIGPVGTTTNLAFGAVALVDVNGNPIPVQGVGSVFQIE